MSDKTLNITKRKYICYFKPETLASVNITEAWSSAMTLTKELFSENKSAFTRVMIAELRHAHSVNQERLKYILNRISIEKYDSDTVGEIKKLTDRLTEVRRLGRENKITLFIDLPLWTDPTYSI